MDYATRAVRALLGATAHPGGTALSRHLLDALGVGPGDRALDVACGDGATLRLLRERGAQAVGVDVEPRARGRSAVADAHALPLPDASRDVVLVECAVSTFADPARALTEAGRVLVPAGRLGMTDVVLDRERADPVVVDAVDRLTAARPLPGYVRLLEDAGFVVALTEDRRADAAALTRRLRRRLALASPRWSRVAAACERAVADGSLSYALLTARVR